MGINKCVVQWYIVKEVKDYVENPNYEENWIEKAAGLDQHLQLSSPVTNEVIRAYLEFVADVIDPDIEKDWDQFSACDTLLWARVQMLRSIMKELC